LKKEARNEEDPEKREQIKAAMLRLVKIELFTNIHNLTCFKTKFFSFIHFIQETTSSRLRGE
jgi:hypothetical protein